MSHRDRVVAATQAFLEARWAPQGPAAIYEFPVADPDFVGCIFRQYPPDFVPGHEVSALFPWVRLHGSGMGCLRCGWWKRVPRLEPRGFYGTARDHLAALAAFNRAVEDFLALHKHCAKRGEP